MLTLSPCAVDSINPSDHHSQPSPRRVPISRRLSQLRKLHLHRLMYLIHPSSSRSSSSPPPLPARQHHLLFQSIPALRRASRVQNTSVFSMTVFLEKIQR